MEAADNKGKELSESKEDTAKAAETSLPDNTGTDESGPGSKEPESSKGLEKPGPKKTGLKGTRSLRKLRDRVERAAHELIRLREENTALQQRIDELEAMPASSGKDAGLLLMDSDPEALKRKVEGFIQSIDNYLDNNKTSK